MQNNFQLDNLSVSNKLNLLLSVPLSFNLICITVLGYFLLSAVQQSNNLDQLASALIKAQQLQAKCLSLSSVVSRSAFQSQGDLETPISQAINDIEKNSKFAQTDYQGNLAREIHAAVSRMRSESISILQNARSVYTEPDLTFLEKNERLKPFVGRACQSARLLTPTIQKCDEYQTELLATMQFYRKNSIALILAGLLISGVSSFLAARLFAVNTSRRLDMVKESAIELAIEKPISAKLSGTDEFANLEQDLIAAHAQLRDLRSRETLMLCRSGDVICAIDQTMKLRIMSPSVESCWGYEETELLGASVSKILAEPKVFFAEIERLKGSTESAEFQTQVRMKNASIRDFVWNVQYDHDGNQFFCLARDVTDQKCTERAKQRLLAIAGHDLRSPLTALLMKISLIRVKQEKQLSEIDSSQLTQVENHIQGLSELIETILALEKLSSKNSGCTSLLDVCASVKEGIATESALKSISLKLPTTDLVLVGTEELYVFMLVNISEILIDCSLQGDQLILSVLDGGSNIVLEFRSQNQLGANNMLALDAEALRKLSLIKQIVSGLKGSLQIDPTTICAVIPAYEESLT